MQFRVTIELDREILYEAIHEARGAEPALQDAMRVARRSCAGRPIYLSQVTLKPLDAAKEGKIGANRAATDFGPRARGSGA